MFHDKGLLKTNGAAKYWKVAVICLGGGGPGQQTMKHEKY